jgi:hypothetical protein
VPVAWFGTECDAGTDCSGAKTNVRTSNEINSCAYGKFACEQACTATLNKGLVPTAIRHFKLHVNVLYSISKSVLYPYGIREQYERNCLHLFSENVKCNNY